MSKNSSPPQEDMRIRRTKKLIWEALLTLLQDHSFTSISVKAICEQAMVNRATFYSHFTDKYALLEYGTREAIQAIVKDEEETSETREHLILLILEHVRKHQRLYALFLLEKSTESLSTVLLRRFAANFEKTLADLEKQGKHFAIPTSLIAQFQAGAVLRVLSWWAEQEMRMPPKELAGYIHQLLMTIVEGDLSDLRKGRGISDYSIH